MDVRVSLVRMECHGIAVPDPEFLSRERAGRSEHFLRWRRRGHRQHNFVDQLGFPRFSALVTGTTVLTCGQLEVPGRQKLPLRIRPGNPFALVRLDLELPFPADVAEMRGNGAGICTTAGDLNHYLRRPSHGPPDLFDLCWAEPRGPRWSRTAETGHFEKWRLISRQTKRSSTHTVTPSSEVPPAPNRLCAALQPQRRS